jgi:hypothetical protein
MRGKPLFLSRKPGSEPRAERKRRAESAFAGGSLPNAPPAELAGMPAAKHAWRKLMRAHAALPGELFNGLDRGFLIGYCLAVQGRENALELSNQLTEKYSKGEADIKELIQVRTELRQSIRLVSDLEKQLYATPKSRGGVAPAPREATPEEIIANELRELNKELGE